jgi:glycosyltransferase involved in cell wall biosynthesis
MRFRKKRRKGNIVLLVHNEYIQRGGEEAVVEAEAKLLTDNGVEVVRYTVRSIDYESPFWRIVVAINSIWSLPQFLRVAWVILLRQPTVMHVHNTFPVISPSIFFCAKLFGVRTIYTLHNYRIVCPTATLFYKEAICERSLVSSTYWAIGARAYRESRLVTLLLVMQIEFHRKIKTWLWAVDSFIVLTEFSKSKFVLAGIPREKIRVKSNFLEPRKHGFDTADSRSPNRDFGLFVGRITAEKGVKVLLDSWSTVNFPLKVIGDGPKLVEYKEMSVHNPTIEFLGNLDSSEVSGYLNNARFIVIPSLWYEGFPMVVLEAFAHEVPIIASDIGSLGEIVQHEQNGLLFPVGNSVRLSDEVRKFVISSKYAHEIGVAGKNCLAVLYSGERSLSQLREVYGFS